LHDEGLAYAKHIEGVAECVELNETKGTFHGYDILAKHPITRDSTKKRIDFMKSIIENMEII
jgi:acetyl esterase